jgi:hypothetical protein
MNGVPLRGVEASEARSWRGRMAFPQSSLRTQGPITPGLKSEKRSLPNCPNESPRRRDERSCAHAGVPAFAGTTDVDSIFKEQKATHARGAIAPEPCMTVRPGGRGECRVLAAPAASRAKFVGSTRVSSPQVQPDSPGIPARNGFNGLFRALPGDEFFLSPSSAD